MSDAEAKDARAAELEAIVREQWSQQDGEARFSLALRPDGLIDLTVISEQFEGRDDRERQALFWPVFDAVPKSDLLHLTCCLLLTPKEAQAYFTDVTPPAAAADSWDTD